MQIAFDDHPDGIDLEYRDGADKPLYHCKRPVLRLEAENALLDYLDGIETWKHRFEWEVEEGFGGVGGSGGRSFFKKMGMVVAFCGFISFLYMFVSTILWSVNIIPWGTSLAISDGKLRLVWSFKLFREVRI